MQVLGETYVASAVLGERQSPPSRQFWFWGIIHSPQLYPTYRGTCSSDALVPTPKPQNYGKSMSLVIIDPPTFKSTSSSFA